MIKQIKSKFASFEGNSIYLYLLLAAIILVAIVLRFYKLGEWSFWGDEMYTLRDVQNVFNLSLFKQKPSRLATYFILEFFGTNEWSARLFPALVGVISIPLLYFPIKKIFGSGVALLAGLLLAISPWHLYWSQNARFYTSLLLLFTLGLFTFYIAIEEDRPGYLLLSMFFMGLAAWEHLTALLFGPIAICYLVLLKILPIEKPAGLRLRNILILFLPGFILALFFASPILLNPTQKLQPFDYANNNPLWILAGVVYYVGLPVICIGTLGSLYLLTRKSRIAILLILGALIPLVAIMAIALFKFTANRYAFISLTSWILLAAVAAKELLSQTERYGKLLAIGALSILLLAPLSENLLYYKYQNGNRDNWKDAFALVGEKKEKDELVVVPHLLLADYYLEDESICMCRIDLSRIKANSGRVWFVEDMTTAEKYPQIYAWLSQNAQVVANLDVHVQARNFKMRVYLYESDNNLVSR